MSIPANSGNWKGITQNRLSATGSSSYAVMNSGPDPARIGSRIGVPKKKDDSPPVTPDSTCEPPPRPARQFQEGDDVFFHTDDGQHVLGSVGQIVGQTCQVLFGDGTQQWASFKRIKKLTATFEEEEESTSVCLESEQKRASLVPKEETIEMFCTVCGVKKKISVSKAKTFKPEGTNVFKCRKCSKLAEPTSHSSPLSSFFKLPQFKGQATSVISNSTTSLLQNVKNGITIPTASGSLSIFRQTPASASQDAISNAKAKTNSTIVKSPRTLQQIAGPSRLKPSLCFNCEKETEPLDRIPCNLCGRFCHLSCLPLNSPPPPKGDRFWDLMCSSCGTQNNETNSRSRVFSVRRNISSWSDVADLILSCIAVGKPSQQFFDLDTEILHFLEGKMNNLKLPRHYTLPSPENRKKFIIHALCTSRLRFVNGKEVKKRASLWALRVEAAEHQVKVKQEAQSPIKIGDKETASNRSQFSRNVFFAPISTDRSGQMKSSRKQPQPTRHSSAALEPIELYKKKTVSLSFGVVPSQTISASPGLNNSASICNLANFVQTASALSNQYSETRKASSHELNRKQIKRLHSASPRTTPERLDVPAIKKIKLSPTSNSLSKSKSPPCHSGSQPRNVSLSPVKKTSVVLSNIVKNQLERQPSTGEVKKRQIVTMIDKNKPKAIKSSDIVPAPVQQTRPAMEVEENSGESSEENPKKIEKGERIVKPKLRNLQLKASILKRAAAAKVKKLKIPNREEPLKIKKALGRRRNNETKNCNVVVRDTRESKIIPVKLTVANGKTATKQAGGKQDSDWLPSRTSKRILEMKNSVVNTGDIIASLLAKNNSTLMDAILYGGYSMQCLPLPPKSETEERTECLKVYGHYRTEKQNETASILLGRTENETRSQTRRKSEMFGRRTRDLNDFDSYDVVARKVDELGLTHYFVIWKGNGDESDSEIDAEDLLDFDAVNDMDEEIPAPEVRADGLDQESSQQCVLPFSDSIDVT